MGRNPTKAEDNVYCQARKNAAMYNDKLNSREGAAELLGVSVSSVSDYELGTTKVMPVDKVVLMADLYNAPELLNHYCSTECPIGCRNVPKIEVQGVDRAAIKLVSALRKIDEIKNTLLDIVEDGVISEDEQPQLQSVMEDLSKIVVNTQELKLCIAKNNK